MDASLGRDGAGEHGARAAGGGGGAKGGERLQPGLPGGNQRAFVGRVAQDGRAVLAQRERGGEAAVCLGKAGGDFPLQRRDVRLLAGQRLLVQIHAQIQDAVRRARDFRVHDVRGGAVQHGKANAAADHAVQGLRVAGTVQVFHHAPALFQQRADAPHEGALPDARPALEDDHAPRLAEGENVMIEAEKADGGVSARKQMTLHALASRENLLGRCYAGAPAQRTPGRNGAPACHR